MARLTDEDRKEFWRSDTGVFAKFLFWCALAAFVLPIIATFLLVALKNPNVNGIVIGLGVVVAIFLIFLGFIVSIVGIATYRRRKAS